MVTLLSYLSQTLMLIHLSSEAEAGLLNITSNLTTTLGLAKFLRIIVINLVTLLGCSNCEQAEQLSWI